MLQHARLVLCHPNATDEDTEARGEAPTRPV